MSPSLTSHNYLSSSIAQKFSSYLFFAHVEFRENAVVISLTPWDGGKSALQFYCARLDRQLSMLVHRLPLLSHIDTLELASCSPKPDERDPTPWLNFLRLFSAVETLRVGDERMQFVVATALAELAPEETEKVLPMLQTIVGRFESEVIDIMRPFLHARSESDHPMKVMQVIWLPVPSRGRS